MLAKALSRIFCLLVIVVLAPSIASADVIINDFNSLWSGGFEKNLSADGELSPFSRLTTSPVEGPSYLAANFAEPVSLDGKYIRVKLRINSIKAWGGIEMRLTSDANGRFENYLSIPVPFYSDAEFNLLQDNQWSEITLTFGEATIVGDPDITKITQMGFYIASQTNAEPTFQVDFKDFNIERSVLPAIVSMTFDDGYDDHYAAAQIMAKYGLRGTAFVMTREIGEDGYVTEDQLLQMGELGWSISSHHKIPITEFTAPELQAEIDQTTEFLQSLGFTSTVPHFAYPLGKQNRQTTLPLIRANFLTARIAGGGAETLPPSDWHMLRTYNVTPDKTPEMLRDRIEKAIEHNEWLILMFHYFSEGEPEDILTYNYDQFEEFCKILSQMPVRVHPVNEVYEALNAQ